jgi:hypothetical protein
MEDQDLRVIECRTDDDFFYREAITELGRYNDRRFSRSVSRTIAVSIFICAILYFLVA